MRGSSQDPRRYLNSRPLIVVHFCRNGFRDLVPQLQLLLIFQENLQIAYSWMLVCKPISIEGQAFFWYVLTSGPFEQHSIKTPKHNFSRPLHRLFIDKVIPHYIINCLSISFEVGFWAVCEDSILVSPSTATCFSCPTSSSLSHCISSRYVRSYFWENCLTVLERRISQSCTDPSEGRKCFENAWELRPM